MPSSIPGCLRLFRGWVALYLSPGVHAPGLQQVVTRRRCYLPTHSCPARILSSGYGSTSFSDLQKDMPNSGLTPRAHVLCHGGAAGPAATQAAGLALVRLPGNHGDLRHLCLSWLLVDAHPHGAGDSRGDDGG